MAGGEFYLKRANDAMRVPSLILNLIWLAFTRLSPFIEGERIEVRGRPRMLIGKNYPSPSLLSLAKGEATKALSPHLIYRQADTHQQYARQNTVELYSRSSVEPFMG
jgi:hypothetical protein